MTDPNISDVDEYARLAVRECARLRLDLSALRERVAELESRLDAVLERLEQAADRLEQQAESRPSIPSDDRLERLAEAIERRIRERSEPPPDSAEVKTAGGTRVRAPWWLALVLALVLLLIAAIWRVEELSKALSLDGGSAQMIRAALR